MDELENGRRIRDYDKYYREKGCMCLWHFMDPHCGKKNTKPITYITYFTTLKISHIYINLFFALKTGSDGKSYDNACFFLCAQQRVPSTIIS